MRVRSHAYTQTQLISKTPTHTRHKLVRGETNQNVNKMRAPLVYRCKQNEQKTRDPELSKKKQNIANMQKHKRNNRGLVMDVEPRHVAEPLGTVATATAGGSRRVCEWAPRGLRHQSGRRWWSLGWVELVSAGVAPISAPNRHQIYQVRTGQLSFFSVYPFY